MLGLAVGWLLGTGVAWLLLRLAMATAGDHDRSDPPSPAAEGGDAVIERTLGE